ncbi:DISARM anti-phage system protein DrmE domain-containing protein [Streptomyces antimycoticus]|uniref:DISARM anti-phage system protein DrmE domain-containing protein n=1 Tax=Streptomyces antimycoticus TaxID=68175 RepID=UPI0010F6EEEA|nr:hypothetical protein [Streptomyces antimycoticus]
MAPFVPTAFDFELLSAVEAAVAAAVPIAVVLPLPGTTAPLLLGAATLVRAILRDRSLGHQVAVVSPHLASRTLYDQLFFKDQRLADYVPRTSVSVDGLVRVVGTPRRNSGGRLHLVSGLARLSSWSDQLSGLVIDGAAASTDDLRRKLAQASDVSPLVYLTADPGDLALSLVREAGGVVWGWDSSSLAGGLACPAVTEGLNAGSVIAGVPVLAAAARSETIVLTPGAGESSSLDIALGELRERLVRLTSSPIAPQTPTHHHGLRWAWGVFNMISMLPTSPVSYDRHAGRGPYITRLCEVVPIARSLARSSGNEMRAHWSGVSDALADALMAAEGEERMGYLIPWVATSAAERQRTLLVVRNSASRASAVDALNESTHTPPGWEKWVTVGSLADLVAGRIVTEGLSEIRLSGPPPRGRSGLLGLPPAPILSVLTTGPLECRRALRQAVSARSALHTIREETIARSASRLSVHATPALKGQPPNAVRLLSGGTSVPRPSWTALLKSDGPWDPLDVDLPDLLRRVVAEGREVDETRAPAPARVEGGAALTQVTVLTVEVASEGGGMVLLVAPNDVVTRRRGVELQKVAAKSLVKDDVIYLVDHAARGDLLGVVIRKLSESPAYAPLEGLVSFWHGRARLVADSGMTYGEIHHRMHGTSISSAQTIGTWVRGQVNGPHDPEDVRRFARAVHDQVLLAQAERVGWALKTLQIVHRKAGRWLSTQIASARPHRDDALIDANLDLRVSDLLESVTAHSVRGIDRTPHSVPAHMAGHLFTPDESELALNQLRLT